MATQIEVKYFNTFLLKKVFASSLAATPSWNGSLGIPFAAGGANQLTPNNNIAAWTIEESRIEGGYNNSSVDLGVKAYLVEEHNYPTPRSSSLIYSGVINSRTGVNNTNQFPVGEEISKSLDPANGTIQKIYAEDTNLTIFQENKVSRALIDKSAIYSAEGGGTVTSTNSVIGQVQTYAGEYGISRDPQSFAAYGYRKYFTDRDRNAVLRLSQDGMTEISSNGMMNFFRSNFADIDNINLGEGKIIGGWDSYSKQYILSLQNADSSATPSYKTLGFSETTNGFNSFFSYKPSQIINLKNNVYTFNGGSLWKHYSSSANRASFYGVDNESNVTFVFNPDSSMSKSFLTINYEGTRDWAVTSLFTESDTAAPISNYSLALNNGEMTEQLFTNNFKSKENKFFGNVLNITPYANGGEVQFGQSMSGIKGFFATVTMSTYNSPNTAPELYVVSSEYKQSPR